MYKGNTVAVVVPAYNEEGFVGEVIETVPEFVDRVYAVDDRSTDGTWEEIREHAESANQVQRPSTVTDGGLVFERTVVPIRHEQNRGVGGAIKTGYQAAIEDGIDVVAVMNGDGQMDPAILDRIVDPVATGRADYAKGNRLLYPEYREGMSAWRFFGNSVLTFLTKIASGYWKMMDPQNGYTAVSSEVLETIDLDGVYEDYGFCNDMLVRMNVRRFRVADIAMPAVYGDEESSIRYSRFIPGLSSLLFKRYLWRLRRRYLVFDFHPLALFYLAGMGTLATGVASLLGSIVGSVSGSRTFHAVLVLSGIAFLLSAMVLDMKANEHLEHQIYQ